jgi:hypothetical protein
MRIYSSSPKRKIVSCYKLNNKIILIRYKYEGCN